MRTDRVAADRQYIRAEMLAKKVSGVAQSKKSGKECAFFIWDVSPEGLGIWASESFDLGDELRLIIRDAKELKIAGTVQWTRPQDEMGGIRCGLKVSQGFEDLEELYKRHREKNLNLAHG